MAWIGGFLWCWFWITCAFMWIVFVNGGWSYLSALLPGGLAAGSMMAMIYYSGGGPRRR